MSLVDQGDFVYMPACSQRLHVLDLSVMVHRDSRCTLESLHLIEYCSAWIGCFVLLETQASVKSSFTRPFLTFLIDLHMKEIIDGYCLWFKDLFVAPALKAHIKLSKRPF